MGRATLAVTKPGLPLEAVTQSFAVLAVKGAGKSNTAVAMAEEMWKARLPWVAIDPKGDWWGIRSNRDGDGPGLPVPIFGGLHGDLPLSPDAGRLIAQLVVDRNFTCVLDVSEFPSKAAQARFLTEFGDTLFRLHGQQPQPRHLFLEEADEYIPQRVYKEMAHCVGQWTKIVKQGRQRGLGITLVSQRSAVINKDALTQTETLIVLRTTSPQDQDAIEQWTRYHSVSKELVESLALLEDGEAWIISPHWLKVVERRKVRQRNTYDSGATPTISRVRKVTSMSDVDLGELEEKMSAMIAEAEANDPDKLKDRVAELQAEIDECEDTLADLRDNPVAEQIEVQIPMIDAETLEQFTDAVADFGEFTDSLDQVLDAMKDFADGVKENLQETRTAVTATRDQLLDATTAQLARGPALTDPTPKPAERQPLRLVPPDGGPTRQSRRMLEELVRRHPVRVTTRQLSTYSGYSMKSSSFKPSLDWLIDGGYVEQNGDLAATPAGIELAGRNLVGDSPSTPAEQLEMWVSKLPSQSGAILRHIVKGSSDQLTFVALSAITGYSLTSSSFMPSLRVLEDHGFIELDSDRLRRTDTARALRG
jgi:hypothetical protein